MRRTRRTYTQEFKKEAVRLFQEGGHTLSQVAQDLEVDRKLLKRWSEQLEQEGGNAVQAFPGKGHLRPQEEEMRQMRREIERLREEREILKKALAIFSGPRSL
jgi:transposase